ncbi:MAG: NFACT RNA binding domain-containing protein, partial [Acholeplasmatales bacterium]|nr:NFACT RNA binding domain-containing protein [Acholeplasmatales bacterium]
DTKKADTYKLYGELLMANSYIKEKSDSIKVLNYYTNEEINIPLDKKLYVKENANLYFKKYRKSKNTVIHANEELAKANDEIEYFKLLESQIMHAEVLDDVLQIQDELIKEHYLIPQKKQTKLQKPRILTFDLDGSLIYVGKNNVQNEIVTYDLSRKEDLWFHVKDAPGSHVLLKKDDDYTENDIRTCANIAAYYSTLQDSSSVPVNYTKIKYVKSIPGKKKCFVSISHEKTIYIDPNKSIIDSLTKINK